MEVFTSYSYLKKIKLRPQDSTMLNLRLKVNLPDEIEVMIGLLPSFVSRKFSIEKSNWISNKIKDQIIQLDISNRHFFNSIQDGHFRGCSRMGGGPFWTPSLKYAKHIQQ